MQASPVGDGLELLLAERDAQQEVSEEDLVIGNEKRFGRWFHHSAY